MSRWTIRISFVGTVILAGLSLIVTMMTDDLASAGKHSLPAKIILGCTVALGALVTLLWIFTDHRIDRRKNAGCRSCVDRNPNKNRSES